MNSKAQKIAIAKACGWEIKACMIQGGYALYKPDGTLWTSFWDSPSGALEETLWDACSDELPDYPSDLNAMHEAVDVVLLGALRKGDPRGWDGYVLTLSERFGYGDDAIEATAAQRARALLEAIGKWEDDR